MHSIDTRLITNVEYQLFLDQDRGTETIVAIVARIIGAEAIMRRVKRCDLL